jgi:hypothetical protein
MGKPQVKGSLLLGGAESVRRMLENGVISRGVLEARLSAKALETLESKIEIYRWHPVAIYREFLDLFWEVEGQNDPEFMRLAGEMSARSVMEGDTYQAFLKPAVGVEDSVEGILQRLRVTCRVTDLFYDFVKLSVEYDADQHRIQIIYENAEAFSEAMFLGTQGFLDGFASLTAPAGASSAPEVHWQAERPEPGRMVFSHVLDANDSGGR